MSKALQIPTMAEMAAKGEKPEYLFWVGCAGSYDPRAQKVTKAFCEILESAGVSYAILGNEESCTGDPARRAGNEFVFQMQALQNIQTLNGYEVTKIVTACPHCMNTLMNEYPELGGHYEVIHHTVLLNQLIEEGRIQLSESLGNGKKVTYHDSCYLGRANGIYEAPRSVIRSLEADLREMKSCGSNGLCCGAGGAQMFKEEEEGRKRVNIKRTEEALDTGADIIAVNCPFCLTMMSDGIKNEDLQDDIMVYDLAELIINPKVND